MTREEAIKNLEMIGIAFVEPVTIEQRKLINDTFNIAIKALSQEPCDDAISRQAVLEIQTKYAEHIGATKFWQMRDDIKSLSSVTQKSGKWIIRDDLSTVRYYQCSECNEIDLDISDYCPNCGAKMVEPQESEGI